MISAQSLGKQHYSARPINNNQGPNLTGGLSQNSSTYLVTSSNSNSVHGKTKSGGEIGRAPIAQAINKLELAS